MTSPDFVLATIVYEFVLAGCLVVLRVNVV